MHGLAGTWIRDHVSSMLTLLLLRHGKSSWDDPELEDFDRPLSKRGIKASRLMGSYLGTEGPRPDLILCSSAARTRETLALVLEEMAGPPPKVEYEDGLYLATPTVLVGRLRRIPKGGRHVMLVGHNPGMQALALELIGKGDRKAISQVAIKFPTAALAVLEFNASTWSGIKTADASLAAFVSPRSLDR